MKALYGEYGSFIAEVISGSALLAAAFALWPIIREFMSSVVIWKLI